MILKMFNNFLKNGKNKNEKVSIKNYLYILFIISFLVLISAYVIELFFKHPPCKLCKYQRIPYFLLLILIPVGIYKSSKSIVFYSSIFLLFCITLISGFHSLVERKLISFDTGCSSTNNSFENIEELRNFLEKVPIVKCDEILFSVFGLSLANLNLMISITLILLGMVIYKINDKRIQK